MSYIGGVIVGAAPRGYIDGLTMSNFAGSTLRVLVGVATVSVGSNSYLVSNPASPFRKNTNVWAAGSGNGGLDQGTITINSWYAWYIIYNPSSGAVDFTFTVETAGNDPDFTVVLPSGFTAQRYIGSWKTDGSGNWATITQTGDDFTWGTTIQDLNNQTLGTVAGSSNRYTLSVPLGKKVKARTRGLLLNTVNGTLALIYSPEEGDPLANSPIGNNNIGSNIANVAAADEFYTTTDTSGRVGAIGATASNSLWLNTVGWTDPRGRSN